MLLLSQKGTDFLFLRSLKLWFRSLNHRDISKDKDKCDGGEEEDGKEQNTPRGRKTANSQGRRKGRITTRSMANEAATVAAEEAPPSAPESALPDPPQLPRSDPAQKPMKEPVKPQTPVTSMDPNKGEFSWACSLEVVKNTFFTTQEQMHWPSVNWKRDPPKKHFSQCHTKWKKKNSIQGNGS